LFLQDDNYVPVMKESSIDVKAISNAYKEKKKMRDDSNVVKIGKTNHHLGKFKEEDTPSLNQNSIVSLVSICTKGFYCFKRWTYFAIKEVLDDRINSFISVRCVFHYSYPLFLYML